MSSGDSIEVDLQSTDYDTLKKAADDLVTELRKREDVMQVHSSVENAAPVIKVNVDPVKAEAEGLTPASIGSMVYSNLSGVKAATISVNGNDQDVKVEFAPDRYDSIAKLQGMMITTATGNTLPLEDLAEIYYQDSPQEISRKEKQYQVSITMQAQADYKKTAEKDVKSFVQNWEFPYGVEMATNSLDESMGEELSALGMALVTAIFLIFIVMAIQFESPKFSLMVMATIPFSLIGSFGFLFPGGLPDQYDLHAWFPDAGRYGCKQRYFVRGYGQPAAGGDAVRRGAGRGRCDPCTPNLHDDTDDHHCDDPELSGIW